MGSGDSYDSMYGVFVWVVLQFSEFIHWLFVLVTRPNGSTRSEDYTQMTTLFNQNESNDFIWFFRPKGSLAPAL